MEDFDPLVGTHRVRLHVRPKDRIGAALFFVGGSLLFFYRIDRSLLQRIEADMHRRRQEAADALTGVPGVTT